MHARPRVRMPYQVQQQVSAPLQPRFMFLQLLGCAPALASLVQHLPGMQHCMRGLQHFGVQLADKRTLHDLAAILQVLPPSSAASW